METVNLNIHRDIIERCKAGDRVSQYKLYQLYGKAMYSICVRLLNQKEWAEDVLQDAFVDVFMQLNSFRYESTLGAWIKRLVVNKCINALTKKKIEFVKMETIAKVDIKDVDETIDEEELSLTVAKVKQAMCQLADGYRVVFSLYMLEGYDHEEIAEILGVSESTSKSQLMRAKQKIKEIMIQI